MNRRNFVRSLSGTIAGVLAGPALLRDIAAPAARAFVPVVDYALPDIRAVMTANMIRDMQRAVDDDFIKLVSSITPAKPSISLT